MRGIYITSGLEVIRPNQKLFKAHPLAVGTKIVVFAGVGANELAVPYEDEWPGPKFNEGLLGLLFPGAKLVPQPMYGLGHSWVVEVEDDFELVVPDGFVPLPVPDIGINGWIPKEPVEDVYYRAGH